MFLVFKGVLLRRRPVDVQQTLKKTPLNQVILRGEESTKSFAI